MAERIQRRREAGWRMPTGAVYVGRPGPWGNPYIVVGARSAATAGSPDAVGTAEEAVERYAELLRGSPDLVDRIRRELPGRDLACWCALDRPCHADVLLRVAAGGQP